MGANDQPGDRRADAALLRAIHGLQKSLDARQAENRVHLETLEEEVDRILRGFPDEDPDAHCRYHESVIEWQELRNKMVRDALMKAASAGALGALGWLAYAIWQSLKLSLGK